MVSEPGSPLRLDGLCVVHASISIACVLIILVVYMLENMHGVGHGCSDVVM